MCSDASFYDGKGRQKTQERIPVDSPTFAHLYNLA